MNRLDRLLGGCIMLLLSALALRWAVELVVASWVPLVAISVVVGGAVVAFSVWRSRRDRW